MCFQKYHRKWTEKQIKPPLRFWRIGFSSSVDLAKDTRSPLLSHAASPPRRFCSMGSQRPATPSLGCVLQATCGPGTRKTVSDAHLGAESTKSPKRLPLLPRPKGCVQTAKCFAPAMVQVGRLVPEGASLPSSLRRVEATGPLHGTLWSGPSIEPFLLHSVLPFFFLSLPFTSPPPPRNFFFLFPHSSSPPLVPPARLVLGGRQEHPVHSV